MRCSRLHLLAATGLVTAGLAAGGLVGSAAAATTPTTLSGTAFVDSNRNGVLDAGESLRSGDALYLFDASGNAVATTTTGADGSYSFTGLAASSWTVSYTSQAWWSLRDGNVPTTTGSLQPSRTVPAPSDGVDFGWRPITRSSTPVTTFTGPQGLRVESYDDVVPAKDLYDALARGTLGAEAPSVVVRFDASSSSTTTASAGATNGHYDSYSATSWVTYASWLDGGDDTLSHEYGHAWSLYRAYLVQQD
ncbi:MAG: SdrD B-like domain, partial [Frankiales bacterium]|nr:SdrD B-like domain [Frankiales bacterium]